MRPIAPGLSPNTSGRDYVTAFLTMLMPWTWKRGNALSELQSKFKNYFGGGDFVFFNAGRSAFLAILQAFDIGAEDEVLIQAFTCVAVPNSILWAHAKPVFVDIDDTFNIDIVDAQKKISKKTKALVVQHTFGYTTDLNKIRKFCDKNNLLLIEDCAHSLGGIHKDKKLGLWGDAAFFSFGRDKIISSVFGGAALINEKWKAQQEKLKKIENNLPYPSFFWIFQQLMHVVVCSFVLPTYNFLNLGKVTLWTFQKLHLVSFPVYPEEKTTHQPQDFPKKYPNALAKLLLSQFDLLDEFNRHRREIAQQYTKALAHSEFAFPTFDENSTYLRFTVMSNRADELRFRAKRKGMLLGNWYSNVIDPKGVSYQKVGYALGSCPVAEKMAKMCLNLPTYPTFSKDYVAPLCKFLLTIV